MGRADYNTIEPGAEMSRFELARCYLDAGGYDNGGAYWGHGAPLYRARAFNNDGKGGMVEFFLRAASRDVAKATVLKQFPAARFYR